MLACIDGMSVYEHHRPCTERVLSCACAYALSNVLISDHQVKRGQETIGKDAAVPIIVGKHFLACWCAVVAANSLFDILSAVTAYGWYYLSCMKAFTAYNRSTAATYWFISN